MVFLLCEFDNDLSNYILLYVLKAKSAIAIKTDEIRFGYTAEH